MQPHEMSGLVGILLAAGKGSRFDQTGSANKLVQRLANGDTVVGSAAKNLLAALPTVLAVVRPGNDAVRNQLQLAGCQVTECPTAEQGMGASLAHALSLTSQCQGWIIALGDMPQIKPATIAALVRALENHADIAAPSYLGRRGHPVAFSRKHLRQLLQLHGDQGARSLLKQFPVCEVAVDDAGVIEDIDTMIDLERCGG